MSEQDLKIKKVIGCYFVRNFESAEEEMKYHALCWEKTNPHAEAAEFFVHRFGNGKPIVWTSEGWKYLKDDNQ